MSGAIEITFSNKNYIYSYSAKEINLKLGTTSLSNKEYFSFSSQQFAESTVA
jgi:hypothetical protein